MENDYEPRHPQDALDNDDRDIDPITLEESEDLSRQLHVDPHEFGERLDATENADSEESEEYREQLEDLDQET